jgi:hypothetical protein
MIDKGITYEDRKNFRGGGLYQGVGGYGRSSSNTSSPSTPGPGDTGGAGGRDDSTQQFSTISVERDTRLEKQRKANEDKLDTFKAYRPEVKTPPIGLLSFLKGPLQGFADFTAAKNRPFFEDVIRAGKLEGVNFGTVSDMSPAQLEQAYQNYMSQRLSGNIDAYGNKLSSTGGDDTPVIQPITPITGMAAPIESGIASINTPYTFEDYINSFQFYA